MKTTGTFKGSWFFLAVVLAIVVGEIAAWEVSNRFGLRHDPLRIAVICLGLVTAAASVLYRGVDSTNRGPP